MASQLKSKAMQYYLTNKKQAVEVLIGNHIAGTSIPSKFDFGIKSCSDWKKDRIYKRNGYNF